MLKPLSLSKEKCRNIAVTATAAQDILEETDEESGQHMQQQ
jgi:hypothetical protein